MLQIDRGKSETVFSSDRRLRFRLTRSWGEGPHFVWVMLNPSTADELYDDPTVRKVKRFTELNEGAGFTIVNLCPVRTAYPKELRGREKEGWGDNGNEIYKALTGSAARVIVAWGNNGKAHAVHRFAVLHDRSKRDVECLGVNKNGTPRHPLMLPYKTQLEPFHL